MVRQWFAFLHMFQKQTLEVSYTCFYRLDEFPVTQTTASKHRKKHLNHNQANMMHWRRLQSTFKVKAISGYSIHCLHSNNSLHNSGIIMPPEDFLVCQ